jgi:probable F420-dependent oxidoreductase
MKISAGIPHGLEAGPAARALEATGYDYAAAAETQHDPFIPLAIAAEHTEHLRLTTGIAVAFARNPMLLANLGHDLNALSKGRFTLGLGTQIAAHITKRFSMPWSHPAARMREMIRAMHAIWDTWYEGAPLDFHGEFYTHTLMTHYFAPLDIQYGRPKIALAAVGPIMTRVAAEVADAMLCHAFTTARYLQEVTVPLIETTLAEHGRDRRKFEIVATMFVAAGDTEEEVHKARTRLRQQVSFYGSTPAYKGVFELHGWHDLQPKLNRLSKEGRWDEMAAGLPEEVVDAFVISGTPEQVVDQMRTTFAGKVDRTSFGFDVKDPDRLKALIRRIKAPEPAAR